MRLRKQRVRPSRCECVFELEFDVDLPKHRTVKVTDVLKRCKTHENVSLADLYWAVFPGAPRVK